MSHYSLAALSDTLRIWDTCVPITPNSESISPSEPLISIPPLETRPSKTCWSGAFDTLATSCDHAIRLYDPKGHLLDEITPPNVKTDTAPETITALSMGYRSSRHIYFGGSSKVVRVWDRSEQKILNVLSGHHSRITSIALTTDDQRVASASLTGDVMIHSLKHGTRSNLNSPFKQTVNQVQFYPFKKSILLAAGDDGSIALWDIHQKLEPWQLKKDAHLGPITGVAFAPCNKHLYCTVGRDKMLRFHDIQQASKNILYSFESEEALMSVSINDDHSVAVGTAGGSVVLYDVRWRGPVLTIPAQSLAPILSLAFQPPKWAVDAATKNQDFPAFKDSKKIVSTPIPQAASNATTCTKATGGMMDMFSPVNTNKTMKIKDVSNLRKVTLFKNLVEQSEVVADAPKRISEDKVNVIVSNVDTRSADIEVTQLNNETQEEVKAPSVIQAWETVAQEAVQEALVQTIKEQSPKKPIGGMVSASSEVFKNDSPPPRVKKLMSATASDMSNFQYQILENIVQDSLADFRDQIRTDVQNMHLELLRQFQIQKMEMETLFQDYMPRELLMEELTRLREENARLRTVRR